MTTVYGRSDDLVEVDGDVVGEGGYVDNRGRGTLVVADDGTILELKHGKGGKGIWAITVINKGPKFDSIEYCDDEDAEIYSDIAYLQDGVKTIWFATEWERAR